MRVVRVVVESIDDARPSEGAIPVRSVTEAMREATSLLEAASVSIQFQRQCVFSSYRRRHLLCARHEWVSLARRPTVFSVHRWQPEYSETALKASTECCSVRI